MGPLELNYFVLVFTLQGLVMVMVYCFIGFTKLKWMFSMY